MTVQQPPRRKGLRFASRILRYRLGQLAGIKDSKHRVAGGFALGLFLGVIPGTGALASMVMAWLCRVNKAAALAGSLLVNTWINVIAFPLALGLGAWMTRLDPTRLTELWSQAMAAWTWSMVLQPDFYRPLIALALGYLAIGLAMSLFGYGLLWLVLDRYHKLREQGSKTKPRSS